MERNLTCIVCPIGCDIKVQIENGKVTSVIGNTCPRGKAYAESEVTNPVRTITTTVKSTCGSIIPVKTLTPIAKEKVFEAMKIINSAKPCLPILAGDVIIEDVFGAKLVATQSVE
jgi:CxxC motif-containing protein